MREFQFWRRWQLQTLSCAVVLLGLGAVSCGGSEELPTPSSSDQVAPSRIEIIGGVMAGETFSGQRTLEAVAEDDSGHVAKVSFFIAGSLACADATARTRAPPSRAPGIRASRLRGTIRLVATAQDATGNTTTSAPVPFSISTSQAPTLSAITGEPRLRQ